MCVIQNRDVWNINLSPSDLRFSNLTFQCIRYHKGIDRYFDVCLCGEKKAKKKEYENDDWGIYINFAPAGTLLIQLESIVTHRQKHYSKLVPFLNDEIFTLPKDIEIFSCASHNWSGKWGGDIPECRHELYLIDQDSKRPPYLNFLSYYSPQLTMHEIEKLGLFSKEKIRWSTYEKINHSMSNNCQMMKFLHEHYPNIIKKLTQKYY